MLQGLVLPQPFVFTPFCWFYVIQVRNAEKEISLLGPDVDLVSCFVHVNYIKIDILDVNY